MPITIGAGIPLYNAEISTASPDPGLEPTLSFALNNEDAMLGLDDVSASPVPDPGFITLRQVATSVRSMIE